MLGLETALALAVTELVPRASARAILALLSWQPAAIAGLDGQGVDRWPGRGEPGQPVRLRPHGDLDGRRPALASRSRNTPYAGRTLTGRVRHTVLRGEPVVVDGGAQR